MKSPVGRKIVMAVSGFSMIVFVVVHLLGNTTIYSGPGGINAYAAMLHRFPAFLWTVRLTLLGMFALHVYYGVVLTLENRAAKPQAYAMRKYVQASFASRNMIWSGLLIGVFIVYHLLQFTFQMTNPEIGSARHLDAMGRPDVFMMVVLGFRKLAIAMAYVAAMVVLGLHLSHSIQSALQTAGLNGRRSFKIVQKGGTIVAIIIFLGFAAFPIVIFAGLLK